MLRAFHWIRQFCIRGIFGKILNAGWTTDDLTIIRCEFNLRAIMRVLNTPNRSRSRRPLILGIFGTLRFYMLMLLVHIERSLLVSGSKLGGNYAGRDVLARRRQHHEYSTIFSDCLTEFSSFSYRDSLWKNFF